MKEAASLGGLTSRFATDIVNRTIEAFDKIVDPLVLYFLNRASSLSLNIVFGGGSCFAGPVMLRPHLQYQPLSRSHAYRPCT
jgi:hypothetical protein